jgi:hypothetical protein
VLIAPFYSAVELMLENWLFDFIPLLQSLRLFPKVQSAQDTDVWLSLLSQLRANGHPA